MKPATRRPPFRHDLAAAFLLGLLLPSACGPSGRIKEEDEPDLVGDTRAGAAEFQRLVEGAVHRLLQKPTARAERFKIAFLDVENQGIEELVDWRDTLRQRIDEAVNDSGRYVNISDRFVRAALREAGVQRDELYIPEKRRRFLHALEASGNPVDYLLYASINTGTTKRGNEQQRDYLLTLELVDVETGVAEKVNENVRKEYLR
jgi:Arc/MetJ-type ribon-helix-helix transcriptional regulator